ncbi:hypothetical protein TanjilG_00356 [Lupinus angustifolius]|uniref:ATP synthase subunit 9, mitochondrial n=2 Tax=50 kb inversion clade TaxID=2231393 RepID=A0A1J7GPE6_LUPAN|nr:hypothetical protein TanjilG_00356 [Lupinus angustifolius]
MRNISFLPSPYLLEPTVLEADGIEKRSESIAAITPYASASHTPPTSAGQDIYFVIGNKRKTGPHVMRFRKQRVSPIILFESLTKPVPRVPFANYTANATGAKSMGAGAATIASAGAAVGIGNVFSSLIHSVARNPSLAKQLFGYAILGFALTEAIALFALMMAFLILFVF